ncbi:SpoIIAA family protein [Rubinisphaera margarita]|uniref:STAS/SEC14 domain-containing protein n=1 Tax=Rubinisphaera margarita TaxID=2909586 RepID=UPI001EE86FCD|nr:STAS/SEC14 domain-containing protein [Rubinisphaera margarita]MCG6154614.1 STAS/SEC14 domain-containing protein [Rubinisphaera margarita]
MSFNVTEVAAGKILIIEITGKLEKAAYEAFVPIIERRIEEFGKIRMVVVMHDFHGWDAGAMWEDIKFDLKHFRDIEKLALVGESKWEEGMAKFCKPFTTAEIKYFHYPDKEAALEWIEAN